MQMVSHDALLYLGTVWHSQASYQCGEQATGGGCARGAALGEVESATESNLIQHRDSVSGPGRHFQMIVL